MSICVVDKGCGGLDNVMILGGKEGGLKYRCSSELLELYRTFLDIVWFFFFSFFKIFSFLLLPLHLLPKVTTNKQENALQ